MQQDTGTFRTTELPPASLILCSRNRPTLLADSVHSVLHGHEVPAELIIVDQSDVPHPTLGTHGTGRACAIHYLWTLSRGVSRARNVGMAAAHHDLLVFTDDDILASATWFGRLARALRDAPARSVVTGAVVPVEEDTPGRFAPSTKCDERPAVYEGRIGADVLFSGNMAFYRGAVEEVGGFDQHLGPGTAFPGAEDNDLCYRLLEAGYRILYVPEAVLYHRAWRAERDYLRLRWTYGKAQGAFFAKHMRVGDGYMLGRFCRSWAVHLYY
jgi:GT2 family glycosyltransferase